MAPENTEELLLCLCEERHMPSHTVITSDIGLLLECEYFVSKRAFAFFWWPERVNQVIVTMLEWL